MSIRLYNNDGTSKGSSGGGIRLFDDKQRKKMQEESAKYSQQPAAPAIQPTAPQPSFLDKIRAFISKPANVQAPVPTRSPGIESLVTPMLTGGKVNLPKPSANTQSAPPEPTALSKIGTTLKTAAKTALLRTLAPTRAVSGDVEQGRVDATATPQQLAKSQEDVVKRSIIGENPSTAQKVGYGAGDLATFLNPVTIGTRAAGDIQNATTPAQKAAVAGEGILNLSFLGGGKAGEVGVKTLAEKLFSSKAILNGLKQDIGIGLGYGITQPIKEGETDIKKIAKNVPGTVLSMIVLGGALRTTSTVGAAAFSKLREILSRAPEQVSKEEMNFVSKTLKELSKPENPPKPVVETPKVEAPNPVVESPKIKPVEEAPKPTGPQKYTLTYPETVSDKDLGKVSEGSFTGSSKAILQIDQQEGKKISSAALEKADIAFNKTKLKQMQDYSPEFKANPTLTAAKNEEGTMMLSFRGDKTSLNIKPEAIGVPSSKLAEGDIISLKGIKEEKGNVPFIKDESGDIAASADSPNISTFGEKRPPFVQAQPKTAVTKEGDISINKKLVSKKRIIDDIRNALDATILPTNKQRVRGALGYIKVKSEVIRINNTDDVEVAVHEIAHLMEKKIAGGVKAKGGLSGAIVPPEFRKEVSALASKPRAGGSVYSEGFAEFMRVYATDREFAKKLAPEFSKYVEGTLLKENPGFKAVLDNVTEKWSTFMKQSSIERGLSQISFDASNVSPTLRQRWNNFYKKNVDALDPFRLLDKRLEALGLESPNFYRKFRIMAGSTGKADSFLFNKTFNYVDGKLVYTGEGLHTISDPIKTDKDRKLFSLYLASRRTLVDTKKKTGISASDARQGIEDIEKRYPHFKEMAQKVYDYSNRLLDYAHSSGLITSELRDKLQKSGLDYIPLYRVQEDTRKFFGAGKKLADIVAPIKKRKGSGDIIVDPMENLVKNTYAILEASEKNKIWSHLGKVADTLGGVGGDLENIKAGQSPVAKVNLADELRKKMGIPEEMMPPELDELFNMLGGDAINIFRPSMFKPEDNVITYFRKGKLQNMRVSSDLYEAAMSLDESQIRFAGDWLAKLPAKVLRSGAILNPDFMAKNPIRDSFTSLLFAKKGYIIDSLYYSIRGAKSSITKDEDYWKWVVSGGSYVSPASYDRNTLQKNAKEVAFGRKFKDVAKSPLEALRRLSEMGEAANRMGEFKRISKGSMDANKLEEGAFAAREVTVDFQRIGTRTKALNTMAAFWNVGIQSTDRLVREFRDHPAALITKGTLGLTVPSVLLWTINKDNPEYQRKSSYEKDAFWLIPFDDGKRFVRVPKPFELGMIFASLPERMLDAAYKEDPKAMEQWAANFVSQLPGVPIPTAAVPITENLTNFSFFKHRPLESQSMKNLAPSERFTAYTPELYKYLGKKLNLSPVKIQNIVEGYTAGLGKTVEQSISVLIKSDSTPKDLSEYPVLRTFLSRPSSGSGSSKVQDLYDKSAKVTEFASTFNRMVKDGRAQEAQNYYDKHPEMEKFLRVTDANTLGSTLTERTDAISKLNTARTKIFMSSMSEEEKKKATKEINDQIDKISLLPLK